jgi:hypothetical protein
MLLGTAGAGTCTATGTGASAGTCADRETDADARGRVCELESETPRGLAPVASAALGEAGCDIPKTAVEGEGEVW